MFEGAEKPATPARLQAMAKHWVREFDVGLTGRISFLTVEERRNLKNEIIKLKETK